MKIGEFSIRSGVSRDTIRYYEKLGLLTIEDRDHENNYKRYTVHSLERLSQIQRLKNVGFTLSEIRHLLCGTDNKRCEGLPDKLQCKIDTVNAKIATLRQFKIALLQMQQACDESCSTVNGLPSCVPTAINAQASACG